MVESLKCPFCGWTGAAKPIRTGDEPAAGVKRGTATGPADAYECEACRQVWEERTAPPPAGPAT